MNRGSLQTAPAALLVALLLAAPFGGGGASSTSLLVLHTLALLAVGVTLLAAPGRPPAAVLLAAGFAVWCFLAGLRDGYRFASMAITWDVILSVGVLWAAWRLSRGRRWLVWAVLAGTLLQAVVALGAAAGGAPRSAGTFQNPNHASAYLNLALGLILARLLARRRAPWGWWVAGGVLAAAQLWPVASRGGLAALLLVALGALIPRAGDARRRWIAAAVAVALLVAAGLALNRRFASGEDVYRYARLGIWLASLTAAVEHPLAGLGPGRFEHLSERYNFPRDEGPVRYGKRFRTAHSQYIEVLVETGSVGVLLFAGAAAALLLGVRRGIRGAAGVDRIGRRGILLGLVALALHGIVEVVLASPAVLLSAAALGGSALPAVPGPVRRAPRRMLAPAIVAAAALYYGAVLAPWLADRHFMRLQSARDVKTFREELAGALRHNPFQPYYYYRAADRLLDALPRLDPASYAVCYNYAAKAAALHPRDPWLHVTVARVSLRGSREVFGDGGGLETALESYRRAVDEAPTDPRPAAEMAALLLDLGRDGEALAASEEALRIEPHFLDVHAMRIAALERLGREDALRQARARREATLEAIGDYRPRDEYEAVILAARRSGGA